jgi:hypothetical protein
MSYRGHVENGVVILDEPATLPEGAPVQVDLVRSENRGDETGTTLYERLKSVIGAAQGLPPDAAMNVDHYLYGQPKPCPHPTTQNG